MSLPNPANQQQIQPLDPQDLQQQPQQHLSNLQDQQQQQLHHQHLNHHIQQHTTAAGNILNICNSNTQDFSVADFDCKFLNSAIDAAAQSLLQHLPAQTPTNVIALENNNSYQNHGNYDEPFREFM